MQPTENHLETGVDHLTPPQAQLPVPINPTNSHLNVQRANAASQIFCNTVSGVSPIIAIPGKLAQVILSSQAIFKPHIKPLEATAHSIQATLALAQLTLFTLMFFKGEECTQTTAFLCKLLEAFNAFYEGTLLVGWVPSEFSQARAMQPDPQRNEPPPL